MARKRKARVAGIYIIRNQKTGFAYVGSTRNVNQRWTLHRCDLRAGRHSSKALQAAWAQDGHAAFAFEMLEEMPLPLAAATLNYAEEAWHNRMTTAGVPLYSRRFRPRVEKADSFGMAPTFKVTIRIPRNIFLTLKADAEEAGQSFNDFVVYILRQGIELAQRGEHPKP